MANTRRTQNPSEAEHHMLKRHNLRDHRTGEDTIVEIVESMKLSNEIPAEHVGVVPEILVENKSKAEARQPLFRIARPPTCTVSG